jgi:hypothetical protein
MMCSSRVATAVCLACLSYGVPTWAAKVTFSPLVSGFIRVQAPTVILTHVRVIDGTGAGAVDDQNIVIENGKISRIEAGSDAPAASATTVLDLHGYSVMPGIVGMHNHLYYIASPNYEPGKSAAYEAPILVPQMTFSAPRLYLAGGVTTMRTTGSIEPYADLNLRDQIDAGQLPGPHIDATAPYMEGISPRFIQMHQLKSAEEAKQFVDYWISVGATSFKAYMHITRADLMVIRGDPSQHISDIENTEIVFKDGVGYDSDKLIRSVAGRFGEY